MKILINEKLSEHKYKTPEGYLVCVDSILARTGKQTYRRNELFHDGDETEVEVDRTPEEVFSEATLASFENKPVTVEHPDEDVNVNNYKEYAVGFVRDVKRGFADGQDVILGTLVITDAQTIEEIENGEHTDLSCGYDCDILDEDNPSQKNIRGNHVALCQQGRAGIAKIVDSIKDSMYCVEFSENGQVFKTWVEARDEKEAQVIVLHANPKARIRNVYRDSIDDTKNKLPSKDRQFISNYLRMISTYTSRDVDIKDLLRPLSGHGFNWTIEKIDGWNWKKGEYAYKDYYVSINGYDDKFLVTLYADPNQDWKVKEVNAYFTDSVNDLRYSPADIKVGRTFEHKRRGKFKVLKQTGLNNVIIEYENGDKFKTSTITLAEDLNGGIIHMIDSVNDSTFEIEVGGYDYDYPDAEKDARKYGLKFKRTGKIVKAGPNKGCEICILEGPRANLERMLKSEHMSEFISEIKDSVNDSTYKCEFKLNADTMWTYVKADSPEDAKRELLNKFANAKEITITNHDSIEDSLCDAQLVELVKNNHERDEILAVYQSDIDENLYFYIGKNYCMKDGEWSYNKYKTVGTPQQIMHELENNGWHKVSRGPLPFIDSVNDASRGHQIVVYAENYLSKLGKNNSIGKYDRIIHGVKSLLENGFLEGEELKHAVEREVDRLLKQHGLDSAMKIMNIIKLPK